ncbi:MAG TPA: hypothetical protein VHN80_11635, partial [Kineosporiaceae bacterium]|nr:hypothetical protein [Kineosporiaceae bacterium]
SWLEVVGWAGSALVIYSLTQARVLRFRRLNLVGAVLATGYNTLLSIWPFAMMNLVIAAIDVYWLYRLHGERHDASTYEVVQVDATDAYFDHVLRLHLTDVRAFQPEFDWDPSAPDRSVFLVLRRDETVGMVVVHQVTEGIGQIELDYVTPRFRDFTPAEFVYRPGGVLAERGFRRLLAPPDVVAPATYYPRVGFHLDGGSWVCDVAGPSTGSATAGAYSDA